MSKKYTLKILITKILDHTSINISSRSLQVHDFATSQLWIYINEKYSFSQAYSKMFDIIKTICFTNSRTYSMKILSQQNRQHDMQIKQNLYAVGTPVSAKGRELKKSGGERLISGEAPLRRRSLHNFYCQLYYSITTKPCCHPGCKKYICVTNFIGQALFKVEIVSVILFLWLRRELKENRMLKVPV